MLVDVISVGPLETNCIVVACGITSEGFLVDPGGDAATVLRRVRSLGVKVRDVLLTHAHVDHFGVAASVSRALAAAILLHHDDLPLYRTGPTHAALLGLPFEPPPEVGGLLKDGEERRYGKEVRVRVIHTPGHSPGSVSFLVTEEPAEGPEAAEGAVPTGSGGASAGRRRVLLSGDTLFRRGVGRTDLPGGNHRRLVESIRNRLYPLGDDLEVIPGHGPATTIGEERRENPWVGPDE